MVILIQQKCLVAAGYNIDFDGFIAANMFFKSVSFICWYAVWQWICCILYLPLHPSWHLFIHSICLSEIPTAAWSPTEKGEQLELAGFATTQKPLNSMIS